MNLIKFGTTIIYPYSLEDFRKHNPTFDFPDDLEGVDLSVFEVAIPTEDPIPEYDSLAQTIEPDPQLINGEWVVGWTVVNLPTPEPEPNYPGFNVYMLMNTANVAYKVAVNQVNPDLCYAVALTYNNIVDRGTSDFLQIFPLFCEAAQVTQQHRNEWADAAKSFNLPQDFIDVVRGLAPISTT